MFPASGWLAGAPRPVYLGGVDVQGGWLPVPVTVLIGRADALRRACELLEGARLVTVVGPGGVGKTRLAVEAASAVAAAYETAGFVDGARLRRPEQLLPAVAASIGLRDAGSQPLGKTVRAYLRERAVLLVADNLEHLLPDAALTIAELLADGPGCGSWLLAGRRSRCLASNCSRWYRSACRAPGPLHRWR